MHNIYFYIGAEGMQCIACFVPKISSLCRAMNLVGLVIDLLPANLHCMHIISPSFFLRKNVHTCRLLASPRMLHDLVTIEITSTVLSI